MFKIIKIAIFLCFCAGIAYTWEGDGTFLSRICEYDVKNTIGFKSNGNYIIKQESISYCFDTDKISYSSYYDNNGENIKIVYRYIIKKMLPSVNNTFGLSRRTRSHGSRGGGGMTIFDQKLDTLNVLVNGKKTKVNYKYRFNDRKLNEAFYEQHWRYNSIPDSWYNPDFSESLLTPIERKNIEIIQNLENLRF